jgi:hypothetical protein
MFMCDRHSGYLGASFPVGSCYCGIGCGVDGGEREVILKRREFLKEADREREKKYPAKKRKKGRKKK